jgi:hypothetical protein
MTLIERQKDDIKARMEAYMIKRLEADYKMTVKCRHEYKNAFFVEDKEEEDEIANFEEPADVSEADDFTPEGYDKCIGAHLMIPLPDGRIQGTITKRAK